MKQWITVCSVMSSLHSQNASITAETVVKYSVQSKHATFEVATLVLACVVAINMTTDQSLFLRNNPGR